jgi:TonB family protein
MKGFVKVRAGGLLLAALALLSPAFLFGQNGQGADVTSTRSSLSFVLAPEESTGARAVGPIYHVGNGVSPPILLRTVEAWYPNAAKQAKIEGVVVMDGVVSTDGSVADLKVTQSLDTIFGLDAQALEAVKHWTLHPGKLNGQPVPVALMFLVEFGPPLASAPQPSAQEFGKGAHRRSESGVTRPTLVRRLTALYPPDALRAKIAGAVSIDAVIGTDGRVGETRIVGFLDSAHGLDEVALQSARRWFFEPATLDGRAVPFVATLVIEFKFH